MAKHKNNAEFRRRYSKKRGHFKMLFDWTSLGIVILVALSALAVEGTRSALCGQSCGSFAGWFLVVLGYVPLLLCALMRFIFGDAAAVVPTQAWHLAAVDFIYLVILWGAVRWIARRHSSEFLRLAWHIALIVFCWGAFQLAVFAASALWQKGGLADAAPEYLQKDVSQKIIE